MAADLAEVVEQVEEELVEVEPVEEGLVEEEPVEVGPVEVGPVQVGPVQVEPVEEGLVEEEPVQAEPVQAEPVQVEPVQVEPVAPVEAEPVPDLAAELPEVDLAAEPVVLGVDLVETADSADRKHAPATLRNRGPIAEVLQEELPVTGKVLEVASESGEHCAFFAQFFPGHV
ncbi:Protein of unknown function [Variovorax sp. YR216]|nr:Protein of unknown function [Variovorax sp. YR216]